MVSKDSVFILDRNNIRCDTYLLNVVDKQSETNQRLKAYQSSGAGAVFLPCIANEADITEAVSNSRLPINVMCMPDLPNFDTLNRLGVKRVSMGPFLFNSGYQKINELAKQVVNDGNFSALFK